MLERLNKIAEELEKRMTKSETKGKTITLKIKYSDFTLQTRSKTISYYISSKELILELAKELLYQEKMKDSVRLLGISLSNLNTDKPSAKEKEEKKEVVVQLKFDF